MKKYILTAVLLICLSQYSFPQNTINSLTPPKAVRQSEAVLKMNKLFPALPAAAHTPYDVLNLPGIRENVSGHFLSKLKSTGYVPVKATLDDTIRIDYAYNSNGYLVSSTTQMLRGGEWVNYDREVNIYSTNDQVIVHNKEWWLNNQWKVLTSDTMTYTPEGRLNVVIQESAPFDIVQTGILKRRTYSYDQAGDIASILYERMENNSWTNISRTSFTRNTAHLYLTWTEEGWTGSAWKVLTKSSFSYDESNRVTSMLIQEEDNGVLTDVQRETYTYDNQGRELIYIIERRTDSGLQNSIRETYSYTGDTLVCSTWESWSAANNAWINGSRYTYTYRDGNMTLCLTEGYRDNAWVPNYKNEYVYDAGNNRISETSWEWRETQWENSQRNTSEYDGKNLLWSQSESGSGQTWTNWLREEYKYKDGNAVEGRHFVWKSEAWSPTRSRLSMYFNNSSDNMDYNASVVLMDYSPATGVETEGSTAAKEFSLSQNYPNPFNPSTTINYSLNKEGNVKLTVYDVLGTKVTELVNEYQSAGSHTVKFNASGLSSGIYLYRLESSGMSAVRKFTLIK